MNLKGSSLPLFMKKDNLPRRYKAVYEKLYSELPAWKRTLVDEKHDRQCTELAKQVIQEVEKKD